MEISKESFMNKVTEFMQEIVKIDGIKVFTEGEDTIVFKNLGCDFNATTSEYDKIVEAYNKVLKGVYKNFEDIIERDKNIDEELLGLVYMLAVSSSYTTSDEEDEIDIHFLDETYAKYVIESYYLEWANINIELPVEKYDEALNRIKNRFLEVEE